LALAFIEVKELEISRPSLRPAYREWLTWKLWKNYMCEESLYICDYPWPPKKNLYLGGGDGGAESLKVQWNYNDMLMGKRQLLVKVVHFNVFRPELVFHLQSGVAGHNDEQR
jgi:hypothetical protein